MRAVQKQNGGDLNWSEADWWQWGKGDMQASRET